MPIDLPDWFIQKYSVNPNKPAVAQPTTTTKEPRKSPYRRYLDKEVSLLREPADIQQERERLHPSIIPSTERKIDPIILDRLSQQSNPPLTLPPKREFPSFEPGKKVFTDQKQLERIIAEAPEEGKIVSFKEAFKRARQAGMPEFEYKGDRFNTQQAGETDQEWLSILKQNKVPQTFAEYMERAGVVAAPEKNIDLSLISKKLGPALETISPLLQAANITPEITSGKRNWNEWSLHKIGEAIDMRLKTADPQSLEKLKSSMPGDPIEVGIEGEKAQMWDDGKYQYFIYGKGNKIHIHIERESPEAKQQLIEHMIESGLRHKIPVEELERYLEK